MIDPKLVLKFKVMFEKQKKEFLTSPALLQGELAIDLRSEPSDVPRDVLDEGDEISSHMNQSLRIRLKRREGLYLKKIEGALLRIKNGTFGECMECQEPIELKRLEARPTTTSCLACKEQAETKERLFA